MLLPAGISIAALRIVKDTQNDYPFFEQIKKSVVKVIAQTIQAVEFTKGPGKTQRETSPVSRSTQTKKLKKL
ncbi:MAG: hypothetical protein EZS28_039308 [Streblomastix strix]|uniref:Uncharacterized protein n=1 Tax=Streblomastix strix TaxID=222440 RepID=A0A5J4U626_9EUKA|nr:MAG: hypothetical protein EZS28_039308 [Streblomastix strix]